MARKKLSIDVDVSAEDLAGLASADALAAFLDRLGYDTAKRAALTPQAIGLNDPEKRCAASSALTANRERFASLDRAIDRVVWPFDFAHGEQLVGSAPDGSLPEG